MGRIDKSQGNFFYYYFFLSLQKTELKYQRVNLVVSITFPLFWAICMLIAAMNQSLCYFALAVCFISIFIFISNYSKTEKFAIKSIWNDQWREMRKTTRKLKEISCHFLQIWKEAILQCFFSLSISLGPLSMLSSYNRFKHNITR